MRKISPHTRIFPPPGVYRQPSLHCDDSFRSIYFPYRTWKIVMGSDSSRFIHLIRHSWSFLDYNICVSLLSFLRNENMPLRIWSNSSKVNTKKRGQPFHGKVQKAHPCNCSLMVYSISCRDNISYAWFFKVDVSIGCSLCRKFVYNSSFNIEDIWLCSLSSTGYMSLG